MLSGLGKVLTARLGERWDAHDVRMHPSRCAMSDDTTVSRAHAYRHKLGRWAKGTKTA